MGSPWVAAMISLSAAVALAGVTLNLILGLSRIVLAMARRRDLPPQLAFVGRSGESPYPAVAAVTLLVLGFAIFGDVKFTWSFSAFFVLIYYAVTNLASLRIPDQERLYPRALGYAGLVVCLLLAVQIELSAWMYGAAIVTALVVFKLWRERS